MLASRKMSSGAAMCQRWRFGKTVASSASAASNKVRILQMMRMLRALTSFMLRSIVALLNTPSVTQRHPADKIPLSWRGAGQHR